MASENIGGVAAPIIIATLLAGVFGLLGVAVSFALN